MDASKRTDNRGIFLYFKYYELVTKHLFLVSEI
jgi:hypothetical protein